MGLEFKDDSVSGGLRISRRTEACDVCHTVFFDRYPERTTACADCGVPLCAECALEHACRPSSHDLLARRHEFYSRFRF
jgi:hypothetical protein